MTHATPRILVGFDGSDESKRALRWGAELAHLIYGEVVAIHAWDFPANYNYPYSREGWDPGFDVQREFDSVVDHIDRNRRPARVVLDVIRGDPARVLIAESENATMLVVGSRGLGGFASLVIGSISSKCVHHSVCPVLVVRGPQELSPTAVRARTETADANRTG